MNVKGIAAGLLLGSCALLGSIGAAHAAQASYVFTQDMKSGTTSPDVVALQRYLNTHGFTVASSGVGSSGHEGTYFGRLTKLALIRFQEAHAEVLLAPLGLRKGTGNFFSVTRNFINNTAAMAQETSTTTAAMTPPTATSTPSRSGSISVNSSSPKGSSRNTQAVVVDQDTSSLKTLAITFNSMVVYVDDGPLVLSALSPSSGTVTYTSNDPTIASVSGSICTPHLIGTTSITASQAVSPPYARATQSTQITVHSNHCDPDPCNGNGICSSSPGTFTCICNAPFTGARCDTISIVPLVDA